MFQPLHPLIVAPGHGCDLLMEGALVGTVSVLFLECKPCLDRVLNWSRIRLLPAVDRSGTSESNPSFRYLRCWNMLPKYFFISYEHYTFQGDNPQKKLKSKIYFLKCILFIIRRVVVY